MIIATNKEFFDQQDYTSDSPIKKQATLSWNRLPYQPTTYNFVLNQAEVELEDNLFMTIEDLTGNEETFLHLTRGPDQPRTNNYNTRLQVELSMGSDILHIERNVYNLITLLGDLGGLYGLLISFGASLVSYMTYNNAENFLARHLFVGSTSTSSLDNKNRPKEKQSVELDEQKQFACKEFFQELLPSCCSSCGCLRRRNKDKLFKKAREQLNEELDIVHLLQSLRFYHKALQSLIPANVFSQIRSQSSQELVNLQKSGNVAPRIS